MGRQLLAKLDTEATREPRWRGGAFCGQLIGRRLSSYRRGFSAFLVTELARVSASMFVANLVESLRPPLRDDPTRASSRARRSAANLPVGQSQRDLAQSRCPSSSGPARYTVAERSSFSFPEAVAWQIRCRTTQ